MRALATLLVTGLGLTAALTACSATTPSRTTAQVPAVGVSVSACGAGWRPTSAGPQQLLLHNTDTRSGEVSVTDARSGAVFAEVEDVGPGTSVPLRVTLGSGRYAIRCAMEDEAVVTGPTVALSGATTGAARGVLPVTQADLVGPAKAYQDYVVSRVPGLIGLTTRVAADIDRGDLRAARRDWLPAHLAYERLGAAYGAFGDLDADINGLPDGLPGGVEDTGWAGFHRLEYGLWHARSATGLRPVAAALVAAERRLRSVFDTTQVEPADLVVRAHEISENALEQELTGRTDYGSHSALATVSANLDGTAEALALVRPLLGPRYPATARLQHSLEEARHAVDRVARTPLDALSTAAREHVDADLSELCELLAPVASILEPRRTS